MEYLFKAFMLLVTGGVVLDIFVFRFKYHKEIFGFVCFVLLMMLLVLGLYLAFA